MKTSPEKDPEAAHTAAVAAELALLWNAPITEGSYAAEPGAFIAAVTWHGGVKNHPDRQQAVVQVLKPAVTTGKVLPQASHTRGVLCRLAPVVPFRLACFEAFFRAANRASSLAKSTLGGDAHA